MGLGTSTGERFFHILSRKSGFSESQVGGSVRTPADFGGTHSIKPTYNRLSYPDVANMVGFLNGLNIAEAEIGYLLSKSLLRCLRIFREDIRNISRRDKTDNLIVPFYQTLKTRSGSDLPRNDEIETSTSVRANSDGSVGTG